MAAFSSARSAYIRFSFAFSASKLAQPLHLRHRRPTDLLRHLKNVALLIPCWRSRSATGTPLSHNCSNSRASWPRPQLRRAGVQRRPARASRACDILLCLTTAPKTLWLRPSAASSRGACPLLNLADGVAYALSFEIHSQSSHGAQATTCCAGKDLLVNETPYGGRAHAQMGRRIVERHDALQAVVTIRRNPLRVACRAKVPSGPRYRGPFAHRAV
jgi:hypothetical protein